MREPRRLAASGADVNAALGFGSVPFMCNDNYGSAAITDNSVTVASSNR